MPIYKESAFPPDYRRAEAGQILGAVYRRRSIAVTGLAGMGKSSVVRFCVGHREAQTLHMAGRAATTAFVHVDCVGLACGDEGDVLAEIMAQLQRERLVPPGSPEPNGGPRRQLKDAILALDPGLHLVVALDELDQAAAHQSRPFYNYLAHLRNSRPEGNLSYILASRRLLGPLYELQELLDDPCSIGPLAQADALESLRRDGQRLGFAFDDAQREALLAVTGGHPGFLKNAAELVAGGRADTALPAAGLARQMLASNKVASLAEELWRDLAEVEQAAAVKIAHGVPLDPTSDVPGILGLEQYGLVTRSGPAGEPALFCPLLNTFVQSRSAMPGLVHITSSGPNEARVASTAGEERVALPPRVFALLASLARSPGQVVPAGEIIDQVYGAEAAGVTDAALAQLAKRLRRALDPPARRLAGDPEYRSVETIRNVGYRLNG